MSTNHSNYHGPIIGIDFGTTKTMVAEYDPVKTFAKVRKMGRGGDEMPSSIYVTDEGEVLFGDDADDEGIHDSPNHIRRFKMLLGKTTETNFGQKSVKPTDLASEFLSHVRARLESEVCHRAVEQVVLTVPAMFGPAQRKDLTNAAERAGFKRVELLPEPVAAGIAYCNHHTDSSKNLRFLVVDWGGGTFDLAVVERNGAECKVLLEYVGGAGDIGGEDLDDELWIAVSKMIEDLGFQSLAFQPKHEWGKYRRDLTRVKEGLSAKTQVTASFTIDGGKLARVPIDRSKLEEVIHKKVYQGAGQVAEIVKRCRNCGYNLDFILLVGGTSRIPMIPKLLEQTAGLPCRTWSEGRDAIALGAAIHAYRILESPANLPESAATQSSSPGEKISAMSQYKSLLEGAWIDGVISNDERVFLGNKKKELGLSIEESQAIQIQVLGASIGDVAKHQASQRNTNPGGIDTATFRGGCVNLSIEPPVAAELVLKIHESSGTEIRGILEIYEPLAGGSQFEGNIKGNCIKFVTRADGFEIAWNGELVGDKIVNGSYTVVAKDAKVKALYGAPQKGVWNCCRVPDNKSTEKPESAPFHVSIENSEVGLQVFALVPKEDFQGKELILRTHFLTTYLLRIENTSRSLIQSAKIFIRSPDGGRSSVLAPTIGHGKDNALLLNAIDLNGWTLNIGDTITVDVEGYAPCDYEITDNNCTIIDRNRSIEEGIPCVVTLRGATFSSNYVLKISNIHSKKLKIVELRSTAGNLKSAIEIDANGEAEIGWLELDRNFNPGDEFLIVFQGFRTVQGVIAEGQLSGNGAIWKGLAAAGGLAIAVLGGG